MADKNKVFYIQATSPKHVIGDILCVACQNGRNINLCKCGGLIHEDYTGENKTTVFIARKCDKCGNNYKVIYDNRIYVFREKQKITRKHKMEVYNEIQK